MNLSADTLRALTLAPSELADAIEDAFAERAAGRAWAAPKSMILPPDGRLLMTMTAACERPPLMAVKRLVMNSANVARGLPQINAEVSLSDAETGLPLATLDGNWVTEVRTAALSLVAARRMARPGSAVLALVGTGTQGRAHLAALAAEFPVRELRLAGRGRANVERLAALADELGIAAVEAAPEAAIRGADLVVSSISYTPRTRPFLDFGWLSAGAFAAVTDTFVPWRRETLGAVDRLVIDDIGQERAMSARQLVALERVHGDLGGLLDGTVSGRESDEERTLFAFRGHALADLAASALAYGRLRERDGAR